MITGSYVALVTPMTEAGEVDYAAYEHLLEWHLQEQTDGFVILGTTAESPTITATERLKIIQRTLAVVNKNKPVIVGTGSNSTQHSIEMTRQAYELGADAALLITPYYNKPTQEGLFLHHKAIAVEFICEICGCEQHCKRSCGECQDCPDCGCKQCKSETKSK